MSQLLTLFWLRYRVFKNSLTTRGEVTRKIFNFLLLLIPTVFSLGIGIALGLAVIFVEQFRQPVVSGGMTTVLATLLFLMLVSQSTGASSHFDPRRFLLFPVSLTKLFFLNLISSLSEFSMLMILPSMAGMLIGLGIAYGQPLGGVLAFGLALLWVVALFIFTGVLFAWLLSGRKRSREILFALLIGLMTIGGQLLPRYLATKSGQAMLKWFIPYRDIISSVMDWTPIGVWSFFFRSLEAGEITTAYVHLIAVCGIWISGALIAGYTVFIRLATSAGAGSSSARKVEIQDRTKLANNFLALRLPFIPEQITAVWTKELRYSVRNPATYLTILSSLIFPLIMFRSASGSKNKIGESDGTWWISVWVGYVFMMNLQYFGGLFAYDAAGFRQYLLGPLKWSYLLLGKNAAIWVMIVVQISLVLIGVQLLDHNMTIGKIYAALCSMLIATAIYSTVGNYISIYFPYRVNFGVPARRRENWSGINLLIQFGLLFGVIGLLLVPIGLSFWLRNLLIRYLSFAVLVVISWTIYVWLLERQGKKLGERRFEIVETLTRKTEKI